MEITHTCNRRKEEGISLMCDVHSFIYLFFPSPSIPPQARRKRKEKLPFELLKWGREASAGCCGAVSGRVRRLSLAAAILLTRAETEPRPGKGGGLPGRSLGPLSHSATALMFGCSTAAGRWDPHAGHSLRASLRGWSGRSLTAQDAE